MSSPQADRPILGRSRELARLVAWVTEVAAGRGRAVLVEGEPGIGKSALVRAACGTATDVGCQVFWGNGDELGQALPLLPLTYGLQVREVPNDPRRATIAGLLRGELTPGRGGDLSAAAAEQLLALIDELCAAGPTVLVIDDLQWADEATIALWGRLARSVCQLPLLLVGVTRPVPQRDCLLALRGAVDSSDRIRLGRLPDTAVADLVERLAGGKPAEDLLRLADGAAGNPLYVTELVDALARSDHLAVNDAGVAELSADPTEGRTPGSLSEAIADRLGFLPKSTREVLRLAALLGVDFSVSDLTIVSGKGMTELIPVLEEARAAGVLAESGHNLAFRHPLIRTSLYEQMPAAVRAAWHRDAGRKLVEAGAPVDRVARQLLPAIRVSGTAPTAGDYSPAEPGATERPTEPRATEPWPTERRPTGRRPTEPMDEWVLQWLAGAAPLLTGQAPWAAIELLRRAVVEGAGRPRQRDLLACRLADALYRVGEMGEAEQVATRALDHVTDPDLLVDLHWTLAQCRVISGRSQESLDALTRALAGNGLGPKHRARLLVLTGRTRRDLGEVEAARRAANKALTAGTKIRDEWTVGWALHVLILVAMMRGEVADALPLFDRALAVARTDPALTDLRLLLLINQAVTLGDFDRYDDALAAAREVRQLADRSGSVVRLTQAHSALGQLLLETGQWDDALVEVDVLPADVKDPSVVCCDHGVAALICFHRGDVPAARRHLAAAAEDASRIHQHRVVATYTLARSLDLEQSGAPAAALAVLAAALDRDAEVEDLLVDAVRLAVETGDPLAVTATARAETLARASTIPHRQAAALFCRGLLDGDPTVLLKAAERYQEAGRPLPRAQALEAAAVAFAAGGDRSSAQAAFSHGLDVYSALSAGWDVARLQARFRTMGIRRGPRIKHRQVREGWESLTPTEAKIAALVADGMSNPKIAAQLFLSARTVATHVSHVLTKLGVSSRIDIAREAGRRYTAS